MGEVTAHAIPFVEGLPRRLGRPRILVTERDVAVDEVADRLDPRPSRRRVAEKLPRLIREAISIAVAAREKEGERVRGQVFDGILRRVGNDNIRQARVAHDPVAGKLQPARWGQDTAAPVAERVEIFFDAQAGACSEMVGNDYVGGSGRMGSQDHDHGCRLRKVVDDFVANADLDQAAPPSTNRPIPDGY